MVKLWVYGIGALVAVTVVYNRNQGLFEEGSKDFREGFLTGWVTPGPFTILTLTGIVAWNIK